jgi:hypothetical protein
MFVIPTANDLVTFVKDFTGSTNDAEIKKCIFMAEMSMRNIELPALRSDPYAVENIGIADANGRVPIPGDMNKPILFFQQGSQITTSATATGTTAQFTITLTSAASPSITIGMLVSGTGVGTNATVVSLTGSSIGSVITLSIVNTATVSGTIVFATNSSNSNQSGPWIVYDRIGDRDIITQGLVAQLYLQPVNVPAVVRGKFSEVYDNYQFLPYITQGTLINLYYYRAWDLLFAPQDDILISTTGSVNPISGTGPWLIAITGMTDILGLNVGDHITATPGTGSLGVGFTSAIVTQLTSSTSIQVSVTGGSSPTGGTITNVSITDLAVESNPVLATWAEGYVYATLREYYIKRHNAEDAAIYQKKYEDAWNVVNDQNNLGKWSGGHTKLTSVWQPRQNYGYSYK